MEGECRAVRALGNHPRREAVLLAMLNTHLAARPVLALVGLTLLIGACTPGTGGLPSAGGTSVDQSGQPTPSSSPSVTVAPTPTAEPTGGTGEIDHPTEPTAIVLRMEEGGGFVPIEFNVTSTPQFTLYGDGTVIYRPAEQAQGGLGFPGPLTPLQRATMTPAQVDELLRFALTQGRLADARAQYEDNTIADAPTTTFSIDAGGITKSVAVYALGIDNPQQQDRPERAGFLTLAEALRNFGAQVERGNATDAGRYEPESYRAILVESQPQGELLEWPWDDLTLDDFSADEEFSPLNAIITKEQALVVHEEPFGGLMGILVEAPDGTPYSLNLRPLLPEEEE